MSTLSRRSDYTWQHPRSYGRATQVYSTSRRWNRHGGIVGLASIKKMIRCHVSLWNEHNEEKSVLEAVGILSPAGKNIWSKRTIDMILSNKKYCGLSVAKSGKAFYEIENHHEPIITPELFERTQTAKEERTSIEIGEDGRKHRKRTKCTSQKTPER